MKQEQMISKDLHQQLMNLAEDFSKIGAKKQCEYIHQVADGETNENPQIALEAFRGLYNYMAKFQY